MYNFVFQIEHAENHPIYSILQGKLALHSSVLSTISIHIFALP